MEVEQFKFIYFMEYAHRLLGRGIGAAFGIPLVGLLALGKLKGQRILQRRLLLLFFLGGCQVAFLILLAHFENNVVGVRVRWDGGW